MDTYLRDPDHISLHTYSMSWFPYYDEESLEQTFQIGPHHSATAPGR